MKTINSVELAKKAGLYEFKCPRCGREQKGMSALKRLFELILLELGKRKKVNIIGFGTFLLRSWDAPDTKITKNCKKIHRVSFKASHVAKKNMLARIKEE